MSGAIDLIVQLNRLRDGSRRVTHITEVQGMEGDVITLQDVFLCHYSLGFDENGRSRGSEANRSAAPVLGKLAEQGIRLGPDIFTQMPGGQRAVGRGR